MCVCEGDIFLVPWYTCLGTFPVFDLQVQLYHCFSLVPNYVRRENVKLLFPFCLLCL